MIEKQNTDHTINSRAIINEISKRGKQSVRKPGELLVLSKSSAHRHLQAKEKRDQYPESHLWETEAGSEWIRLIFLATNLS